MRLKMFALISNCIPYCRSSVQSPLSRPRSNLPTSCVFQKRGWFDLSPIERQTTATVHDAPDCDGEEPFGADIRIDQWTIEHKFCIPRNMQDIVFLVIDKEQADARIERNVPEGVEKEIADKVRDHETVMTFFRCLDFDKARVAAPVGNVDAIRPSCVSLGMRTGDEESICPADEVTKRIIQSTLMCDRTVPPVSCNKGGFPSLDIFRAVAETLEDVHVKAVFIRMDDDAVGPVSSAGMGFESQQAERRPRCESSEERITRKRRGVDSEYCFAR